MVHDLRRKAGNLDASETRVLLASAAGFAKELESADRSDIVLVDVGRLYRGN